MAAIGQTVGSVLNMQLLLGNRNWMHLFNRLLLASPYNTNRFLVQGSFNGEGLKGSFVCRESLG